MSTVQQTSLWNVAQISRIVTLAVDRVTGDRSGYPLLTCLLVQFALKRVGIESRVLYGDVAWIEVSKDHQVYWTGCWGEHFSFWVETEFREIIELTAAVSIRRKPHGEGGDAFIPMWGPPLLWSRDIPKFYRFRPQGLAEVAPQDLDSERDQRWWKQLTEEIREKIDPQVDDAQEPAPHQFPVESMVVHRRLLDDAESSFAHFDRALGVAGIPEAPLPAH